MVAVVEMQALAVDALVVEILAHGMAPDGRGASLRNVSAALCLMKLQWSRRGLRQGLEGDKTPVNRPFGYRLGKYDDYDG